ncbi:HlyD family secretion protein [Undibacterium arcticum]|uniref:HlyD family secretion protein n=1 Tax=Undibacterium arcticum TaxID=1762892 RepID=A0ABV7F428_9BURK
MKRIPRLLQQSIATALVVLAACADQANDYYSGYAEADYVRIASPIAGTLAKLYLQRGDHADANAPAFVLEQDSERAAREQAAAQLQRAAAQLADAQKGRRPDEIAAVDAQLRQAQATATASAAELARQTSLIAGGAVSQSSLEQARAAAQRDRERVSELQAQLRINRLGARSDEIEAAQQDLKAAQAQLAQADWRLAQKTQRVPQAAEVADVLYREGEWVAAGSPVLSLLPPQNIKARFFVPETELGKLKLGQTVELRCDGCGAPIAARISFIAREAEYTSPLIYSKENRANLVFMLEARPAPTDALRLHPGQPLEIRPAGAARQ